jgi:hypothetical protein
MATVATSVPGIGDITVVSATEKIEAEYEGKKSIAR